MPNAHALTFLQCIFPLIILDKDFWLLLLLLQLLYLLREMSLWYDAVAGILIRLEHLL